MHEPSTPEAMSSVDLVKELTSNASLLVQRQVKLATLEARRDLTRGVSMAELVGSAGLVGFVGTIFMLVAAMLAISEALGGRYWAGALIVGGALFLIGLLLGGLGWQKRVKKALPRSREEVQKELSWAKYRTT